MGSLLGRKVHFAFGTDTWDWDRIWDWDDKNFLKHIVEIAFMHLMRMLF